MQKKGLNMVVHIVLFRFHDENKDSNLKEAKGLLEGLLGRVPTLKSMEVGINFCDEARAFDLSIYSTFDSKEALREYATHPEHLRVVEFFKVASAGSKVVDYEV